MTWIGRCNDQENLRLTLPSRHHGCSCTLPLPVDDMKIVRCAGVFKAYPHNYQKGMPYLVIKRFFMPDNHMKAKSLESEMICDGSWLIFNYPTMIVTYRRKPSCTPAHIPGTVQVVYFQRAGFYWRCVYADVQGHAADFKKGVMVMRARSAYAAVQQIIEEDGLKARVRSIASAGRENMELRATMLALIHEYQDMALAAGEYTHRWDNYPPALRKARKLVGLPFKGPITDEDIDPTLEVTAILRDEGRW